jgi:hypothetical protein
MRPSRTVAVLLISNPVIPVEYQDRVYVSILYISLTYIDDNLLIRNYTYRLFNPHYMLPNRKPMY